VTATSPPYPTRGGFANVDAEAPKTWPRPWPNDRLAELHWPALTIDGPLRERLLQIRERQMADHMAGRPQLVCGIFYDLEVVCLKAGMGYAAFLGLDGRVWAENYGEGFHPQVLTDARDVASVIVRWSGNIGLPELKELLPARPSGSFVCGLCGGSRWLPTSIMAHDDGRPLCCLRCHGLGWTFAEPAAEVCPPRE
jgi:hypothetical protein